MYLMYLNFKKWVYYSFSDIILYILHIHFLLLYYITVIKTSMISIFELNYHNIIFVQNTIMKQHNVSMYFYNNELSDARDL